MEPTFLPGVENHPQPSPYTDLIRSMQAAGSEYMQIWHLFAFKPEMTAHLARLSQAVMRDPAPISPGMRELIAAYTSALNRCAFCTKAHIGFAAALLEKERGVNGWEFAEAVVRDPEKSALTDKEKTLFRFTEKVTHRAQQLTAEDMQPMYAAGWDDEAIYYVITICALFNFYNRWVGASGVHVLSDEAHRLAGKRSAETGYVRK
ncbi:MAG: peroxidase-related enzyme [Acidobacteriia bacterium]|nr:peroxidase-related enzyme [Terriglobia bacterium]